MSGVVEVQARISAITSRIETLPRAGRAAVDPLAAQAFAGSLSSAVAGREPATAGAAGTTGWSAAAGPTGWSAAATTTGATAGSPTAAAAATSATGGGPHGGDVVTAARRYLGVPYLWGGTDPATGLDCSGLVQRVFADIGVTVPRTVAEQRHAGTPVASMAEARPGDLLVYDSPRSPSGRHIGIYVGDGQMLNAPSKGKDVRIGPVWPDPTGIRRVVPAEGAATTGPGPVAAAAAPSAARPGWAAGGGLAGVFAAATTRYDLPAGLLQAVAQRESGMRTDAVSPAGARGLMQLMPATAAGLGVDPMDAAQAVDGAARYLREQLDTFGSLDLALAAYNAGPGNVRRHGGIPPFPETRAYVAGVTAAIGQGR